jgi:6-pyruvoyltetrahydropterin/6-carboxytetrahydropterin synthase
MSFGKEGDSLYSITAEVSFDAAHFLSGYPGACGNLHGHRWRVVARAAGDTLIDSGAQEGMLLDFAVLKGELRDITAEFDHVFLVERGSLRLETLDALETEGFFLLSLPFRPTAENLARHFCDELTRRGLPVRAVTVYETPENAATYEAG